MVENKLSGSTTVVRGYVTSKPLAKPPRACNSPLRISCREYKPPPKAGSREEYAETALVVGFPESFAVTADTIERIIRAQLLWDE